MGLEDERVDRGRGVAVSLGIGYWHRGSKNQSDATQVFIAVRRRRNLVYAKDTFSIHTRKQCMLQHTQHIGLRRLWLTLKESSFTLGL